MSFYSDNGLPEQQCAGGYRAGKTAAAQVVYASEKHPDLVSLRSGGDLELLTRQQHALDVAAQEVSRMGLSPHKSPSPRAAAIVAVINYLREMRESEPR